MATYKLTTISTFTDNTCSEDSEDLQRYVDDIRDDMLGAWDSVEVISEVNGQVYTSKGEGNRHEEDCESRFANHPWHQLKDELPPENLRVLFHDGTEMHMGWITRKSPMGKTTPEGNPFVVLEDFDGEGGLWTFKSVNDWWWRKVEAPAAIKEEK